MDFNFMILFAKYFPLSSTFSLNQTPTFISKSTFRAKLNWIDSLTERQELKINLCFHDMCTWMYVWAYFQARLHSSENKSRHDSREGLVAKESLLHPSASLDRLLLHRRWLLYSALRVETFVIMLHLLLWHKPI